MFDSFLYKVNFLVIVISNDLDELVAIALSLPLIQARWNKFRKGVTR